MFAGKKSAQIREILISESAWEEMTCLFAPSLGYRYTGVFKTLASIDDKPSRFEILIPLVQTLVRDNVKLNNDVYKELKKFMHDYDKTSPEMRKYLQSINESMFLMKNIAHQN